MAMVLSEDKFLLFRSFEINFSGVGVSISLALFGALSYLKDYEEDGVEK